MAMIQQASVPQPAALARTRVLLVDDDPALRRLIAEWLAENGFEVAVAGSGTEAYNRLGNSTYDVVLSDISMPGMTGLDLLRLVRGRDLDIPVVLMTGDPGLATAMQAVEHGAFRYVVKPVNFANLEELLQRAGRLHALARLKREALTLAGRGDMQLGDRAALEAGFESALAKLWIAYQPIVHWSERRVVAYEAFVRSNEPALPTPAELFRAAERLDRLPDIGRAIRARVAEEIDQAPAGVNVFVNLHPYDLLDDDLTSTSNALAPVASRIVLEVTERASLDSVPDAAARLASLRGMRFRLAVDDLGAGYAGLSAFARLEPEVVKLDMSLVRSIDTTPTKQRVVRSMAQLCIELGMQVIVEGVESERERDVLSGLGCDLQQGFLFARPAARFPEPRFN